MSVIFNYPLYFNFNFKYFIAQSFTTQYAVYNGYTHIYIYIYMDTHKPTYMCSSSSSNRACEGYKYPYGALYKKCYYKQEYLLTYIQHYTLHSTFILQLVIINIKKIFLNVYIPSSILLVKRLFLLVN